MRHLLLAATLAFALPAQADEATDAATAFIESPVQQKLLDDMLSPEMLMTQFEAMNVQIPPEQLDVILVIVTEELNAFRPEMEQAMIAGAAQAFTVDEINALTEFYSSPLGASAMGKMNPYMQATMSSMGQGLQAMQGNIMQRVQEALQ